MTSLEDETPVRQTNGSRPRIIVATIILVGFLVLLVAKAVTSSPSAAPTTCPTPSAAASGSSASDEQASGAVAAYEAALKAGKPIYVMFHSTTCAPCIEIAGVADGVIPDYADRITFVDAVTDDSGTQELASKFSFQYIPTSFFLKADGTTVDSFTGAMDDAQMRGYLDALVRAK